MSFPFNLSSSDKSGIYPNSLLKRVIGTNNSLKMNKNCNIPPNKSMPSCQVLVNF